PDVADLPRLDPLGEVNAGRERERRGEDLLVGLETGENHPGHGKEEDHGDDDESGRHQKAGNPAGKHVFGGRGHLRAPSLVPRLTRARTTPTVPTTPGRSTAIAEP